MSDLFADGVRSVAVANGVLRVELYQMKRKDEEAGKLEGVTSGVLYMPASALKDMTLQLARALERMGENASKAAASGPPEGRAGIDEALTNL